MLFGADKQHFRKAGVKGSNPFFGFFPLPCGSGFLLSIFAAAIKCGAYSRVAAFKLFCGGFPHCLKHSRPVRQASTRHAERINRTMPIRILDVGQCGFDGPRMSQLLREKLDATVDVAATGIEAARSLAEQKYDLALVNRVLAEDGESGVKLIQSLVKSGCTTPLMLVSDHAAAQDQAVSFGAVRGFGKSALEEPETFELIKNSAHAAPAAARNRRVKKRPASGDGES